MKFSTTVFLFLASLVVLNGCKSKDVILAPQIANLVGTWRLVEPDSSYQVTLTFALDTANPPLDITPFLANGKSSVNDYSVRLFATIDGVMSAENLGSTERAGTPEATTFEQRYFTNLKAVVRFDMITPDRLRLQHGGESPHVMIYKRVN
jgi:heat shock protein HslJ